MAFTDPIYMGWFLIEEHLSVIHTSHVPLVCVPCEPYRSRHIDVRKYYVRELVEDKLIKLMPCGTKEMTADAMTKSLQYPAFRTHRNTMLNAISQQETLEATSLRASACWTWT